MRREEFEKVSTQTIINLLVPALIESSLRALDDH